MALSTFQSKKRRIKTDPSSKIIHNKSDYTEEGKQIVSYWCKINKQVLKYLKRHSKGAIYISK